jgi:hypothetical protein
MLSENRTVHRHTCRRLRRQRKERGAFLYSFEVGDVGEALPIVSDPDRY